MTRVVLSQAARNDRRKITQYTVLHFGVQQARRLRDRFESTLSLLAESPLAGHKNEELDPPGHSFRYFPVMKRFIIVYQPSQDGIRVVRLLHGAQNLAAELTRQARHDE